MIVLTKTALFCDFQILINEFDKKKGLINLEGKFISLESKVIGNYTLN
jgi:hypothetical protein